MNPVHWTPAAKIFALALLLLSLAGGLWLWNSGGSSKEETTIVIEPDRPKVADTPLRSNNPVFSDSIDPDSRLVIYPEDDDLVTGEPQVRKSSSYSTDKDTSNNTESVTEESITEEEVTVVVETSETASLPVPSLRGGPVGLTRNRSPRFAFRVEGEARCSLNKPSLRKSFSCTSPLRLRILQDGRYVFRVWAVDGGARSLAAARSFVVDRKPPAGPSALRGPSGYISNPNPSFYFSAKRGARFLCSLDSESFRSCSSPYTAQTLADGKHCFRVRTVDAAGNRSRSLKQRTFHVDTVAPAAPQITSGPEGTANAVEFVFTGEGNEYLCAMNSEEPLEDCTSPATYSGLSAGDYTFRVWARDRAGNLSSSAAWEFVVEEEVTSTNRALVVAARASTTNADSYDTGDTSSAAGEQQSITLEIDPAIEILAIASDSDTVSPQAGGDGGADDAEYEANVDLRSNLAWAATAVETGDMGLVDAALLITGDGDTGGSNGAETAGDGVQEYTVQYSIDVSWADDASSEATPYSSTVDHDVSNTL